MKDDKGIHLTIIVYHYVRGLAQSRFPAIKGRTTEEFKSQLDYIMANYNVCDAEQVLGAARGDCLLPESACWLTFDDGFSDHIETVFPLLRNKSLSASFFPPAKALLENKVLDVHKIHHILAAADSDIDGLIQVIYDLIRPHRRDFKILSDNDLYEQYSQKEHPFDPPQIVFIKRLLQDGLPSSIREDIVNSLFQRFVEEDEGLFAKQLYVSVDQLRYMRDHGMHIGGHGYEHNRLGELSDEGQELEIRTTCSFLSKVLRQPPNNWIMAYPYGSYNESTIELLKKYRCAAALTANVGIVTDLSNLWEMRRIDTNDVPL